MGGFGERNAPYSSSRPQGAAFCHSGRGHRNRPRFARRNASEDGFRDLKQRLGWEECRAGTRNPIERTSQAQWVTKSLLRLTQFRLEAAGAVDWWFPPPWNKKKDRPSVLDVERLFRRHRSEIQQLLSNSVRNEGSVA